jgi:RNase H-fold protein (predicted Holliday junction resolvase)
LVDEKVEDVDLRFQPLVDKINSVCQKKLDIPTALNNLKIFILKNNLDDNKVKEIFGGEEFDFVVIGEKVGKSVEEVKTGLCGE